jgi:hypothetical protein
MTMAHAAFLHYAPAPAPVGIAAEASVVADAPTAGTDPLDARRPPRRC